MRGLAAGRPDADHRARGQAARRQERKARSRSGGRRAERLENVEVIFREEPKANASIQFGGRIVFDGNGHVFLTLGDLGQKERAQRPDDDAGSVIRLYEDGRVPEDNPFSGKAGWKPEKFDLGHRNMQGAALNPKSGALWTHEHGPQGGDEVNIIRAGRNYGWPVMRGDLFVGALKAEILVRLRLEGERVVHEERMLKGVLGRIRDVRMGPDGFLYLATDESPGVVARLEP